MYYNYSMKRLGELLISKGLLTQEQLEIVLAEQKESGEFLGLILVEKEFVNEERLVAIISEQLDIPFFPGIKDMEVEDFVLEKIPFKIARKELMVPVEILGNSLTVVMANPMKRSVIQDIHMLTGLELELMLGVPSEIKEAVERLYSSHKGMDEEDFTEMLDQETVVDADIIDEQERSEVSSDELLKMSEDKQNENLIKYIIARALQKRASDIHVEPFDERMVRIRYRIDSVLYEEKRYPIAVLRPVVTILKLKSGAKIDESRKPQNGRFQYKFQGRDIEFRTSFVPTVYGERVEIRIGDKQRVELNLDALGFNKRDLSEVKLSLARPWGMILVAGPTGSGKTTTLYSMVKEMYDDFSNIMTVEEPVEFNIEGVNQVNIKIDEESILGDKHSQKTQKEALEGKMTFAKALKAFLRQDPDKIMVGEIRDAVTADIAIRAALTGHMVVSSVHTNDAPSVITRLMNIGVPPFLISAALACVVAQKLIRISCPKCKAEVTYGEDEMEALGIEPEEVNTIEKFYRGEGCDYCSNTGYFSRTALFEVMPISKPMQKHIMENSSFRVLRDMAVEEGMMTMRLQALLKVSEGLTTLEEVKRVTAGV